MKNQKTAPNGRDEIILEIKRLSKVAEKYEKIIMGNNSASQKAAAIKGRNYQIKKMIELMNRLVSKYKE